MPRTSARPITAVGTNHFALSLLCAPKPWSSSGLSSAGIPASVAATTPIVATAATTIHISGLMYGQRRRRTMPGEVSPEPIGLLNVGFALKESSRKRMSIHPVGGRQKRHFKPDASADPAFDSDGLCGATGRRWTFTLCILARRVPALRKRPSGSGRRHYSAPPQPLRLPRMKETTLGVAIITKNAAARLAECLQAVAFAHAIVVVDSGSTDATLDIDPAPRAHRLLHPDS